MIDIDQLQSQVLSPKNFGIQTCPHFVPLTHDGPIVASIHSISKCKDSGFSSLVMRKFLCLLSRFNIFSNIRIDQV